MSEEKEPIKINGRYYPLWSKFVHRKAEFIGRKLQDLGEPGEPQCEETIITDITLKPNGKDSAMFSVDGEDCGCGFDVKVGGIVPSIQEPGWITFRGYGGHTWRIQAPSEGFAE